MSSYPLHLRVGLRRPPGQVADQISDAVLDAILAQDKRARVACETMVKTGVAIVAGEITTTAWIDLEALARKVIMRHRLRQLRSRLRRRTPAACMNCIGKQSPDINQGVDRKKPEEQGAGDQGLMFGYACNETDELMPAPIYFAPPGRAAGQGAQETSKLPWLRPDAKSQVTLRYENGKAVAHRRGGAVDPARPGRQAEGPASKPCCEQILKPVLPAKWLHKGTKFHINPTGHFVIGGPVGDCGLTGRKIIVDTYGGWARHGGGAFSGKDPSKVDRSAAYAARYVAKNIVAAGLADRCEVQVTYAIGVAEPTSISVTTFGTGKISDDKIEKLVRKYFDLRPYGIIADARPDPPDVPADRRLRPLRPQGRNSPDDGPARPPPPRRGRRPTRPRAAQGCRLEGHVYS